MRATTLLRQQLVTVNSIVHDIADDLTDEELTTRIYPNTNLLAFDLWHIARAQDWAVQTLARGVPEVIQSSHWQHRGRLATPGIGVGFSEAEADDLARSLKLSDVLEYADAVHASIVEWLSTLADEPLDDYPDLPAHLAPHPEYRDAAMQAEVPWQFQRPPMWRCLNPAIGHARDHLAVMDMLKTHMRARRLD